MPNKDNLCIVSKRLYELTLPKLYETVIIKPRGEKYLQTIDTSPLSRGSSASRLHHAKHVRVSASFHNNLDERCVHFRDLDPEEYGYIVEEDEWTPKGPKQFERFTDGVMKFLTQIEDNALKSFRLVMNSVISFL